MQFLRFSRKLFYRAVFILLFLLIFLTPTFAARDKMKITIWTITQPGADVVGDWIEHQIKLFEATNPLIIVEHSFWENQSYKIKLKVAMFSNQGPDIFYNWGSESQLLYSREGLLYDLTPELGKKYWGLSPGMFATHSYQGRIYGVPVFPMVEIVWYNKEFFNQYGWKTPRTWDELLELCTKIKAKGLIPISMGGQEPWTILQPYMYLVDRIAGSNLYLSAKSGKTGFNSSGFINALQLLSDLAERGYLPPDVLNLNMVDSTQLMVQNKAAMLFMGNWEYESLTNQLRQNLNKWDLFPFPTIAGGKGSPKSMIGAVDGFSISKTKNSKTAVKFLKFLCRKESMIELNRTSGRLVSLSGPYLTPDTRPQIKKIAALLSNATSITQWWDQDLPEPVTQALLQSLQDLIAGKCTPSHAAQIIEEARNRP